MSEEIEVEERKLKAVIYARESSGDTKAPPISNQIEMGKAWIEEQGMEFGGVYQDEGLSGGNWNRPEWNRLIKDARARKFSWVWVWAQDRMARDTEQFLRFCRKVTERGIKIFSSIEGVINMETLGNRVKHTTMAQADEIFRLVTSEKVKGAHKRKKAKAEAKGEKLKWGREAISEEIIAQVFRLRAEYPSAGCRTIAGMLPEYENKKGKKRKPSYAWVSKILNGVKKTPTKKQPMNPSEEPKKDEMLRNNPIN